MPELIRFLADVADTDLDAVGPKAASLARLAGLGLPVPAGFCVTGTAYRAHLEALPGPDLGDRLAALADVHGEDRTARLAQLREAIEAAPLAPGLREALTEAWPRLVEGQGDARVAVRSSATAEDLPGHSFAGQHDTFLGVTDLAGCEEALRRCWASLWTDRATEYRARNHIDHGSADMAVIVQLLVEARASGVAFTADPVSGRRDRVVIESCHGLGEALVSGRVTPDRVVLSRPDLEVLESVAVEPEAEPSLDDGDALRIAELSLRAEADFGVPLDLEFAVTDTPLLLQARPITTLAPEPTAEDRIVWSNVNTAEVLPDVVTPLSWSVMQPVIQALFSGFMTNLGMDVEGHTFFDRVGGRAYANLNTVMGAIRHIPGMRGRGITEVFGGAQGGTVDLDAIEIAEQDIPDLDFSYGRMLRRMPRFVWQLLTYRPQHGDRIIERLRARSDALLTDDLATRSDRELAQGAVAAIDRMVADEQIYAVTGVGVLWEQVLFDNGGRWLGHGASPLIGGCLAGLGNNDNANAGLALWQLAVLAHGEPAVRDAIGEAADFEDLYVHLGADPAGDRFGTAWRAFMAEHGHHARGELELMNPRWSERPDEILGQVRSYLDAMGDHDFASQFEGLAQGRAAAEQQALGRLRNPLKRWAFRWLLHKARTCSPIRENLKSQLVRQLAGVRRWLLELGRRACEQGRLEQADDVFFLAMDELEALVDGQDLRARIDERRAEFAQDLELRPPPIVIGRFDPARHTLDEAVDSDLRTLEGFGVNPGTAEGPARVILRAGTDALQPGEILVAPFTDPGWTPYFLNAAAIVMDQGGLLSHGAIVAREFGIPAVVNVGPATTVIRTGQRLRVDGARGTVTILDDEGGNG